MKNSLQRSASILFACFLAACGNSLTDQKLTQAAELMYEAPDSALSILERIDRRKLGWRSKPRHALLYTQALDKNYIDVDDDSLILQAEAYESAPSRYVIGNKRDRFLFNYYKGRILYNQGRYSDALLHYLGIEEMGRNSDDFYTLGMLYHDVSTLYHSQYDYPSMLKYARLAYDCYDAAGLERHRSYALFYIGNAYFNLERHDSAGVYYHKALAVAKEQRDTALQYSCLIGLAWADIGKGLYGTAIENLWQIRSQLRRDWKFSDSLAVIESQIGLGQLDSANMYFQTIKVLADGDPLPNPQFHNIAARINLYNNRSIKRRLMIIVIVLRFKIP